ncbi:MAG TPA: GIY-YIG nuclease family protein, partial [Candidatus Paceibacterota bacterium]
MEFAKVKKKKLPDVPGVYFFLGPRKKILYIGKAGSLRDRVRSYFSKDIAFSRSAAIEKMVQDAQDIAFQKTDSVLEAVILEADLIKKFRPKYNTQEKDDKSFNYVVITKEDFPRILLVRGRDLQFYSNNLMKLGKLQATYGPFPQG